MILLSLLLFACATFVAWPLIRFAPDALAGEPELFDALEERDRALSALRELEFDHRAGKVLDDDYRTLVRTLRLRAAEALRSVDAHA
ncbi:MAG: hypothetical protein HOQ28_16405 [Thermoleophilia bacterium]|nr:hypothetical protein [Thermoleophilia bacterium]